MNTSPSSKARSQPGCPGDGRAEGQAIEAAGDAGRRRREAHAISGVAASIPRRSTVESRSSRDGTARAASARTFSLPRAAVASAAVRILLIEDHATVRANMSEQLERAGHEVDVAVDGRSGLLLALAGAYDVLVLDLGLPHLDGLELCRRLRAQRGAGPLVLMLTARDTLDDKLEGFAAGADDYLVKPFEAAELLVRLQALARRSPRAESETAFRLCAELEVFSLHTGAWVAARDREKLEKLCRCAAWLAVAESRLAALVDCVHAEEAVAGRLPRLCLRRWRRAVAGCCVWVGAGSECAAVRRAARSDGW